ncbi:MAG: hypothetical protein ABI467_31275 [Kofleriaceae bacterium]
MISDPRTAPKQGVIEPELAAIMGSHITRARIALVLIGILYAWTAYSNYGRIMGICGLFKFPADWGEGSCLSIAFPPDNPIGSLVGRYYFIIVLTGIAAVVNVALAGIAGKKTTLAICTAMGIFAVYTPLRLYEMSGLLSTWEWWVTAIVLGMGFQAAYQANQLCKSRKLAKAQLVA